MIGARQGEDMIDKTYETLERAVADVHDGATVMIGGFGNAGMPSALIDLSLIHI